MKPHLFTLLFVVGVVLSGTCNADIKVFGPGQNRATDAPYLTISSFPIAKDQQDKLLANIYQYKNIQIAAEFTFKEKGTFQSNLFASVAFQGQNSSDVKLQLHEQNRDGTTITVGGSTPIAGEFTGLTGPVNVVLSLHGNANASLPNGWIQFQGDLLAAPPPPTGSLSGLPAIVALQPGATDITLSGTAKVTR